MDEFWRLRTLYQLLASLSHATTIDQIYDAALTALLSATSADRASILMFDADGVMRFKAWRNLSDAYRAAVTGHTPWSKGAVNAAAILVPDVAADSALADYVHVFAAENIRALAFIPLSLDAGVFGKFMLYYAAPHEFSTDEVEIAQAIATHVALAAERKRAESERLQSEQRLQAILDNSPTIVFLKDLQSRYIFINSCYEELFHVSKAAVVGRTDYDLFPRHIADAFVENDRRVIATGQPLSIEEHAPHDDGIHSYISVKFPIRDANGAMSVICGISTDITGR